MTVSRRTALTAIAALPVAIPADAASIAEAIPQTDTALLDLERRIFEHKEAADELGQLAQPLNVIWCRENHRLHDEFEAGRTSQTFDERRAIVEAMPEYQESTRLGELRAREWKSADDLVSQMWAIEAQTPEGRRAKLVVLLGYVMEQDEWREGDWEGSKTFDTVRARDLMIEFVGGEPAKQLREQFS
jgi:hypothetical protein